MGNNYKIVLFGSGGVGKTSFLVRYIKGKFNSSTKMTLDPPKTDEISVTVDDKSFNFQMWDCGGEMRVRPFFEKYLEGAHAVLLFIDLMRSQTLEDAKDLLYLVGKRGKNLPVILVGTKADVAARREIDQKQIETFQELNNLPYYSEISSKTGENIERVFELIASSL